MKKLSPWEALQCSKTDQDLVIEILEGGLNPSYVRSHTSLNAGDDEDDLILQVQLLLKSGLKSRKLKSLARACVLAWQSEHDSDLLKKGEEEMVAKAKEVKIEMEISRLMETRNREELRGCLIRVEELGMSDEMYPIISDARSLLVELDDELKHANHPETTGGMGTLKGLEKEVIIIGNKAKTSLEECQILLNRHLQKLEEINTSNQPEEEKAKKLKELRTDLQNINPHYLLGQLDLQADALDTARAENVQLMMSVRQRDETLKSNESRLENLENDKSKLLAQWEEKTNQVHQLEGEKQQLKAELEELNNNPPVDIDTIKQELEEQHKADKMRTVRLLENNMKQTHAEEIGVLLGENARLRLNTEELNKKLEELNEKLDDGMI